MRTKFTILFAVVLLSGCHHDLLKDDHFGQWRRSQSWYQTTPVPQTNTVPNTSSTDFWNSWNAGLQRQADEKLQLNRQRFKEKMRREYPHTFIQPDNCPSYWPGKYNPYYQYAPHLNPYYPH